MSNPYSHPRWERLRPRRPGAVRTGADGASRPIRDALVSLVGLVGCPVRNQAGDEVGRLVDIVVAFADGADLEPYPPATGLIVRIARRRAWIPSSQVGEVTHGSVTLDSARLDLREFARRRGEVALAERVLDHQLIDIDDRRVIRAADLVLAPLRGELRLVGVDVSMMSLLRRLGPARLRVRPTPDRVIDWSAIEPLGDDAGAEAPAHGRSRGVRLRGSGNALAALRPAELADLLEELGRGKRQQLLESLDPATAADAVEEMEPDEVQVLMREAPPQTAAELLAEMEPDEAVDALRDLTDEERKRLMDVMAPETARQLADLLGYDEESAGGVMTTTLAICRERETVTDVIGRLRTMARHAVDLTAIVVVDAEGRLLDDVTLLELLLSDAGTPMSELVGPPWPVTISPDTPISEVAEHLIENRSASIVVVDPEGRPLGRILADDLVDALLPHRGLFQIFRQAPS